jgi:hypothetical protein
MIIRHLLVDEKATGFWSSTDDDGALTIGEASSSEEEDEDDVLSRRLIETTRGVFGELEDGEGAELISDLSIHLSSHIRLICIWFSQTEDDNAT